MNMNPDLFSALMNYSNAMKTFLPQSQQIDGQQPPMMQQQQYIPQVQVQQQPPMQAPIYQPQNLAATGLDPGLSGGQPGFSKKQNPLNDTGSGGGGMGMGMLSGVLGGGAGGF